MPACDHCASDVMAHVTYAAHSDGTLTWVCQGHWHKVARDVPAERCPRGTMRPVGLRALDLKPKSPYVVNPRWR